MYGYIYIYIYHRNSDLYLNRENTMKMMIDNAILTRGVLVGLFLLVFIVHKYRPVPVFQRRSTKGRILGRWHCWCLSLMCPNTCISQVLILVHKDAAYEAGRLRTVSSFGGNVRVYGSVGV